jgi:CheY-like chemotaxis protein
VYGIVKQNNGWIYVDSEINKGTTVKIYWICAKMKEGIAPVPESKPEYLHGKESILFVEDERKIREFAVRTLEEYGYRVTPASGGKEALEIIRSRKVIFDMIVTDIIMPEMNGREFYNIAVNIIPTAKILFTSGYPDDHISKNYKVETHINFLNKPYTIESLVQKIRNILDIGPRVF